MAEIVSEHEDAEAMPMRRPDLTLTKPSLSIQRIIAHQVNSPTEPNVPAAPLLSTKVQRMDAELDDLVRTRIVRSVTSRSKTLALNFTRVGAGTFLPMARAALEATSTQDFVAESQQLAQLLAEQHTRAVPEGLLIVAQARVASKKALVLIKADRQDGITGSQDDESESTVFTLLKDLFLTKGSKLHKVVVLVKHEDGDEVSQYQGVLFDGSLRKKDDLIPAQYFIADFLGAEVARQGRRDTYTFYAAATEAINNIEASPEARLEMSLGLHTFMNGPADLFTAEEFVSATVPKDLQDAFEEELTKAGAPSGGILKDTRDLSRRLQYTTVETSNGVVISIPTALAEGTVIVRHENDSVTFEVRGAEAVTAK